MKQIKIIPFDLSLATDDNVYTRDGRKVRIICTDIKDKNYNIVALITYMYHGEELEYLETYTINGHSRFDEFENDNDLFIHQEIDIDIHFEPFQKVLVRNNEHENWYPSFFSHISTINYDDDNNTIEKRYWTISNIRRSYKYCIPYDDFKHLYNTTDNPTF